MGNNKKIQAQMMLQAPPKSSKGRRKMGPPQRKLGQNEADDLGQAGRVSVFCVGSAIDVQALRAHVFRRGFGTAAMNTRGSKEENPLLVLKRDSASDPETEDEVLHVSNAPLLPDINSSISSSGSGSSYGSTNGRSSSSSNGNSSSSSSGSSSSTMMPRSVGGLSDEAQDKISEQDDADLWKSREQILMATQDIFYFDYGVVVFWGLTPREERAAMMELQEFTIDPVSPTELDNSFDTLEFVFDRKANPQRPIRFDRMRLRSLQLEEKLALSYAMAQSSKLFVFESKVLQAVEMTRYLPKELALNGRINSSKKELNKIIGQLFVEQTEVNLFSSILDTPDFLWDDDEHVPAYQYLRSYLEVDDRVALLNSRLSVIRELLDVLTAQVADNNSARLEWIVIWLISIEIIMGICSNPIFAGRRLVTAMLVPTAILLFKRVNWINLP